MKHAYSLTLLLSLLSVSAFAQTNTAPVTEGSSFTPPPTSISGGEPPVSNAAQMELRISNLEDEIRALRGKNEESEFQVKKLAETLEKMQRDTEMRLGDIEGGKKPRMPADTLPPTEGHVESIPGAGTTDGLAPKEPATATDGAAHAPDAGTETTPRDLYNSAFRLLNQAKYEEAASAFDRFTKKYPKDPLVGNAYYWQGETYYIRRDYVAAADNFRAGFEALPDGPKAPDNLLKLAMSLDALKRDKEACIVLQQVVAKFKKDSVSVTEKAQSEQKRMGCK
jgi:tol-pal system protein YbgF